MRFTNQLCLTYTESFHLLHNTVQLLGIHTIRKSTSYNIEQ
jgi:hypothetical protein